MALHSLEIVMAASEAVAGSDKRRLTSMRPFAEGDLLVGATRIRDAEVDDHAGDGRILQLDAQLKPKGVLWVEGTTHLVGGLEFAPDGTLWATDPWSYQVINVSPEGVQLPNRRFADRSLGHIFFTDDETVWLCETFVGVQSESAINTVLPVLPGEEARLGDGDLYHCTQDGKPLQRYTTETHGGMAGFIGLSHAELMPDGRTLVYVSETGPRLMRYDIEAGEQLPDLLAYPEGQYKMFFDLAVDADGNVVACMGNAVVVIDAAGNIVHSVTPPGDFGWSVIRGAGKDGQYYVANWFTGAIILLDLASGEVLAETAIDPKCVSGMARYPG